MADQTQELMFEILRKLQADITTIKEGQRDTRQDIASLRNYMHLLQGDINNMRGTMTQVLDRLDRIENRLELRELQEAQARFEPHP
jgi:predicted  nucleic acid-binding Zn-ribbon protein